ncbi:MAG: hypothetical protein HY796_04945 [Elusimicrobia bacterium]|nr:hypothetical protein [Elusimicrobiota bacterium]
MRTAAALLFLLVSGFTHLRAQEPAAAAEAPSLEDRISQLLIISVDADEISKAAAAAAAGIGGIQLQWGSYSLEDTRRLTAGLRESVLRSGLKVPLFIATDYEGGSVYAPTTLGLCELPTNMMLGAADSENDTASLFYLAGRELKRAGINMTFGPVLDVNTNARNPIIGIRAVGGDPALVSKIGGAIINGFKTAGILAVPKHFPGHGAATQDSHKLLPVITLSAAALEEQHLPPFKRAIELKSPAVMTAHIRYPALDSKNPATLSKAILAGLLKRRLGFNGLVITDSLDMKAITSARPIHKAAALALAAGADLALLGKGDFITARDEIAAQVRKGGITETRINDAYYRVIEAKREAGLFEAETFSSPFDKAYVNIAEALSGKAVTLLRDRRAFLPLKNKTLKTAVIIFSPPRFNENALALYRTLAAAGYSVQQSVFEINPDAAALSKALSIAEKADRLVIGSFQWAGAQNRNQKKAIKALLAAGKPAILVSLMNPYDLANYPQADAAIAIYGMTVPGMTAAGALLAGEFQAQGRLPVELRSR